MSELQGIVHNFPEEQYHRHPALSSTGVRSLLPEYKGSPKKFRWAQTHPYTSRTFDVGHAIHTKVLGVGAGIITYPEEHLTPSGNPSTKKETVLWEDEQRKAGFTIVSPGDALKVEAMAEAVLAHDTARPLFEVATHREVSVFADIDGVPVRARFDALSDETRNGVYGIDLKSTDDATPHGFTRSVAKWGYDVQEAHYKATYQAAQGRPIDQFFFVAVEKSGPYEVAVLQIEPFWVDMGFKKAEIARHIYKDCTATGVWPGYDTAPQTITAPAYVTIEHEMAYENSEIQI